MQKWLGKGISAAEVLMLLIPILVANSCMPLLSTTKVIPVVRPAVHFIQIQEVHVELHSSV